MESVSNILASGAGAAASAKSGLGADFETFLTLLTTQLQVQDPLDPMDSGEFTNQLIQFTNVEQAIQSNQNLENIAALTAMNGLNASVSFIGKDAIVEQSGASLEGGTANWIYALEGKAVSNNLVIKDDSGKIVYEQEGATDVGTHGFTWDGIDNNGTQLPDGIYTLGVNTKNLQDLPVPTQVFMRAVVKAVDFAGGDSFLDVGGFSVPMSNVVSVRSPI